MAKYDYTTPKDILNAIKVKKNQGYFVQRLNDKKQLAQYYEVILKNKPNANKIYNEIREELKRPLRNSPEGSPKKLAIFLRDLQDKETGSFVEYPTVYSLEIERAKHILVNLKNQGLKPKYPLTFLDNVDTGKKFKKYFKSLLYDFSKDNRDELNLAITGLPNIKRRGFHRFSKDWDKSYYECLEIWQDFKTGYWGPWMKKGKNIIKIPDLSTTFHILGIYYDKKTFKLNNHRYNLKHKKKLIKTTWDIRKKNYPVGWLEKGCWSTHHNFDVAEIFVRLFNSLKNLEKEKVRRLFDKFLVWCTDQNFKLEGGFTGYYPEEKEPTMRSTQFGILMLRAVGYFSEPHRNKVWGGVKFPINSYRVYKKEIPKNEFDTKDLECIIYKKKIIPDPLETRLRNYKFWLKNKGKDPEQALNMAQLLEFEENPPQDIRILNKIPKLQKNQFLVAINKYGGVIWSRGKRTPSKNKSPLFYKPYT